jgi:hypothetical protein
MVENAEAFLRRVLANTVQFGRIVGGVPSVYNLQLLALHSRVPVVFILLVRDSYAISYVSREQACRKH